MLRAQRGPHVISLSATVILPLELSLPIVGAMVDLVRWAFRVPHSGNYLVGGPGAMTDDEAADEDTIELNERQSWNLGDFLVRGPRALMALRSVTGLRWWLDHVMTLTRYVGHPLWLRESRGLYVLAQIPPSADRYSVVLRRAKWDAGEDRALAKKSLLRRVSIRVGHFSVSEEVAHNCKRHMQSILNAPMRSGFQHFSFTLPSDRETQKKQTGEVVYVGTKISLSLRWWGNELRWTERDSPEEADLGWRALWDTLDPANAGGMEVTQLEERFELAPLGEVCDAMAADLPNIQNRLWWCLRPDDEAESTDQ